MKKKGETVQREQMDSGIWRTLVRGLPCHYCRRSLPDIWFFDGEPRDVLCDRCADRAMRADRDVYKVDGPAGCCGEMRYVAGECVPGKSTGRERRYMSMGGAENANGCWDNLVRAAEGD